MANANPSRGGTADREIIQTRVLDAPRSLVYEAWTDAKHIAEWWGPDGFTNTIHEIDVRPGGVWRFTMHGPDGIDYPNKIVFTEIVPGKRLVFIHTSDDEPPTQYFETTVTFEDLGSKTLLTMTAVFRTAEERNMVVEQHDAIEGGKQTLARFAAHVATRQRSVSN